MKNGIKQSGSTTNSMEKRNRKRKIILRIII